MPDQDNEHTRGARSNWRRWAILFGVLMLFVVVFDLLSRQEESAPASDARVAPDRATSSGPIRPEITRLGDTGVRIAVEGGYRITKNYHEEVERERLIACIEEGISTSPLLDAEETGQSPLSDDPSTRTVRARQVWAEVIRIHNDCATDLELAPPGDRPRRL